jgi:NAD(P)-dependent dehydrogenase (short-subunit alcohol dehydrogenase family)
VEKRFHQKRVLVTGAGTGIGREIALAFGREGARVALHYSHEPDGALSAQREIEAAGGTAACFPANFECVDAVFRLADEALRYLGGADCLVNNAGITFNKPFLKITPEQYEVIYNVNVRAQFFLAQRFAAAMLQSGAGAIVNMSSIHGLQGAPEHAVYAGTKGAVIAQTRALGIELAHRGVRVNAVAPGWVIVDSHSKVFPGRTAESAMQDASNAVPAGRAGWPNDIAKVVLFLCSDDAQFIVGQTIIADGGTTAMLSLVSDFRAESNARCGLGYVPGAPCTTNNQRQPSIPNQ